jgi:hypothetical protein
MSPLVIVAASVSRAMPKSTTRGPSGPSSTLAGLKSRCTTPAPWIAVSAHLDGDSLFSRVRAAAEVHDPLAALAEPSEELETAQPQGIARLQRFGRHCLLRDRSAGTTTLP